MTMKAMAAAALLGVSVFGFSAVSAIAGDAEIKAAQSSIAAQLEAFAADENATAYSYAAPNIKRIFPTLDQFMGMVKNGYEPVWKPKNYAFGAAQEMSPTAVIQKVLIVGPDGKNYEAVYTLEQQEDGTFRITGVSLRGSTMLGA